MTWTRFNSEKAGKDKEGTDDIDSDCLLPDAEWSIKDRRDPGRAHRENDPEMASYGGFPASDERDS